MKKNLFFFSFLLVSYVCLAVDPAETLRGQIIDYVSLQQRLQRSFTLVDERTHQTRTLELVHVGEYVRELAQKYTICADMRDVVSGEVLDIDFDFIMRGNEYSLANIRIHKDNGVPRYYDVAET